jgi:hypothetical protein
LMGGLLYAKSAVREWQNRSVDVELGGERGHKQ